MKKISFLLIIFFLCLPLVVNAEDGYVNSSIGINLRERPDINSSIVAKIANNASVYISNTNAGAGNGCDDPWYYIYYNGNYGYACSTYIKIKSDLPATSTSYNRPWTTPKKAIVGGAQFIGKSYISKGQSTSYLKKFNVNPDGYYSIYNHQYMSNLRAPAGEAVTTYNSLNKNSMLNNPYEFLIPVYLNMPAQAYNYNGLYSGYALNTSNESDAAFEIMIKDFDESYKPYLRYLHKLHPNWIFTPLITKLDFYDVYANEKNICSIEISSGYCEQNPYTVTESGWCIGNDDSTKYFIDPRNFLTEKYVFMFENLGYSPVITEIAVQSVLKNTFMSDLSLLDNQSYASIFMEAGKNADANVSPLYLASLAIQEVGTNGSVSTSGKEFTYEGYTYSNLYNFFNIGAYSSESNPILAGLVYANGGKGINNGGSGGNVTPPPVEADNNFVSMLGASKVGDYLKGYSIGTTIASIKNTVGTRANVIIKNSAGNIVTDASPIGTGYTIEISNSAGSNAYTYVLYGDLNGDSEINSADLLKLRQHLLGTNQLSGSANTAAKVTEDNEINSADLLRIRQYLLGTATINQ